MKCFKCLQLGHLQVDCENEAVCYKCKETGHMAVECASSSSKKIKMYGFGVPGQGFYEMIFPEAKVKISQTTGVITILEGEANEVKLDKELKNLVRDDWDFGVRDMGHNEFMVTYPDKKSFDTFTRLREFQMSIYGLKGKLVKSTRDPETSSVLQTTWVKIFKIPDMARDVESVKEIAALVMEPLVVDELSLIKDGPLRVQGRCRNPQNINCSIEIHFNGSGVFIRYEAETRGQGLIRGGGGPPPPGPRKPEDREDTDRDNNPRRDLNKKSSSKFDRYGKLEAEGEYSHEGDMEEGLERTDQQGSNTNTDVIPIAAFQKGKGMVDPASLGGEEEISEEEEILISNESQFLVHDRDGSYLLEKNKWPTLILLGEEENVESLTQENLNTGIMENVPNGSNQVRTEEYTMESNQVMSEEDIMEKMSNGSRNSDCEEESQGWQVSASKKRRRKAPSQWWWLPDLAKESQGMEYL